MGDGATGNRATDFSIDLFTALIRHGVRHFVVSPGSRSQAPALVAAELERVGAAELHVRIDERVGGFLALGLALESGAPAVVVTTSGTAIANLHPAVLEAYESRVSMIVVTADRPSELRGIRSNQTTTQDGVFGAAAPWSRDVHAGEADAATLAAELWAASAGAHAPAHLNLALRDPLSTVVPDLSGVCAPPFVGSAAASPADAGSGAASLDAGIPAPNPHLLTPHRNGGAAASVDAGIADRKRLLLTPEPRTVVIAGDKAGPEAEEFARAAGWPLIAEASSGARFGPNLVVAYRELLRDPGFGGEVVRAVVFGHPTLSREVPALLARKDVEVIVVDGSGSSDFYSPGRRARRAAAVGLAESVDPLEAETRSWAGRWVFTSRRLVDAASGRAAPDSPEWSDGASRAAFLRNELAALREPVTRAMLVNAVWRYTWPRDRLVLGASRLIRELDATVTGKKITVHSNRGLGGIDGTVATGIGVALANSARAASGARTASGPGSVSVEPAGSAPSSLGVDQTRAAAGGVTRVLLGDLTLLHDAGALLRTPGERMPPIQVVVGNDRGGTIFAGLEVAASAAPDAFERVQLTPRDVDLEALAAAYGWRYLRAATRGELDQALSAVTPEPTLIEVPLA